jgi:coatomer subunit beta
MEVKRKALGVALDMVSSRNVEDVVLVLKKQLTSTMEQDYDKVSINLHTRASYRGAARS